MSALAMKGSKSSQEGNSMARIWKKSKKMVSPTVDIPTSIRLDIATSSLRERNDVPRGNAQFDSAYV